MSGFKKQDTLIVVLLIALSIFVAVEALRFGGKTLSIYDVFSRNNRLLVMYLRLPRIMADFMVGAGLSVVGFSFQVVVRNPLAEPYLFGISGAAALGYIIGSVFLGAGFSYILSFIFSIFTVLFVVFFGMRAARNATGMILTGVAVGFFYSSIISIMSVFLSSRFVKNIFLWYLGDTTSLTLYTSSVSLAAVCALFLLMLLDVRRFDLYRVGDEFALSSGMNVNSFVYRQYILGSLITTIVVSGCGAIGFVGLIMPHIVRLIFGENNRMNVPLVFFLGGNFMVVVDTIVKSILYPVEIPVGVVTALIGSPFLVLLMRRFMWR